MMTQSAKCRAGAWLPSLMHFAAALGFLIVVLFADRVSGQQPSPLAGQGLSPMGANCTKVYLSVILYKLLTVDQNAYQFEAIMDAYISWTDPRAEKYMNAELAKLSQRQSNESSVDDRGGVCAVPGDQACIEAIDNLRPTDSCTRYCTQGKPLCCDLLWLPGFDIYNAVTFSQDRFATENITVRGSTVVRMVRIYGRFSTPMSFRKFPIDSQDLQLIFTPQSGTNMCVVKSALIKNTVVLNIVSNSDELAAWDITELTWGEKLDNKPNGTENHAPDDPFPVMQNEALAVTAYVMVIKINRQFRYYFWNTIFPVVVTVVLAFVTFFIAPQYIEARLATSVTLMVALAALQWSITSQLPSVAYLTNLHRLVLTSYFMVTLTNVESLMVYFIVRDDFPKREHDPDYPARLAEERQWAAAQSSSKDLEDGDGTSVTEPPQPGSARGLRPLRKPLEERIAPESFLKWLQHMRTHPYRAYRLATYLDRFSLITFPLVYFIASYSIFYH